MSNINFFSSDRTINIRNKTKVRHLIQTVFLSNEQYLLSLNIIFCSDDYLLQINQKYLGHDYFTDVITFLLSDKDKPITGEIYLSVDRIKENAKLFEASYQNELLRVIIHGVLHLCNYKDNSKSAKKIMQERELFYLKMYDDSRET